MRAGDCLGHLLDQSFKHLHFRTQFFVTLTGLDLHLAPQSLKPGVQPVNFSGNAVELARINVGAFRPDTGYLMIQMIETVRHCIDLVHALGHTINPVHALGHTVNPVHALGHAFDLSDFL